VDRLDHEPSQLSGGQQQRSPLPGRSSTIPADLRRRADRNLDSRTSAEVLRMFQQLNEQGGITIIIVTHDANVAKHAQRIIRIHEG